MSKQDDSKSHNSSAMRLMRSLRWLSPHLFFPHGVSGVLTLLLGSFFTVQALFLGPGQPPRGYTIDGPQPRSLFLLFLVSSFVNAAAGIRIRGKAPVGSRRAFMLCGAMQISLVWFAYRLSTEETRIYSFFTSTMDKLAALLLLFVLAGVTFSIIDGPRALVVPMLISELCLSLTFFYPFQLAFSPYIYGGREGNEWFAYVVNEWPWQLAGWGNYVYVPTILTFSLILFVVTLRLRNIVSSDLISALTIASVLVTLVATVLSQEVHINTVSTQRLVIPLPGSHDTTHPWIRTLESALDTSMLAQTILKAMGITLRQPPSST